MSILDAVYRTVTCNGPSCSRTVTFEQNQNNPAVLKEIMDANPWLKTSRVIQSLSGGRNFLYCSDECELAGVASGAHNPEERKHILVPDGANSMAAAAAQARASEEATKALKSGSGVTLQGS